MEGATYTEMKNYIKTLQDQMGQVLCEFRKYAPEVADDLQAQFTQTLNQKVERETEVVYNNGFGGFGLSTEAKILYGAKTGKLLTWDDGVDRHDPNLVEVVKELGERASKRTACLAVVKIEGGEYRVDEYDGAERIVTPQMESWTSVLTTPNSDKYPDIEKMEPSQEWRCYSCTEIAQREDAPPLWHYFHIERDMGGEDYVVEYHWSCDHCKQLKEEEATPCTKRQKLE